LYLGYKGRLSSSPNLSGQGSGDVTKACTVQRDEMRKKMKQIQCDDRNIFVSFVDEITSLGGKEAYRIECFSDFTLPRQIY
jgi:hypothetical protein